MKRGREEAAISYVFMPNLYGQLYLYQLSIHVLINLFPPAALKGMGLAPHAPA
jgi:hypothetical protein